MKPVLQMLLPLARKLHLIVGLTIGLVTVVIGLTGTMLAFRDDIDRALSPTLYQTSAGPSLPLDSLVAAAQAQAPGKPVMRLFFPGSAGEPMRVMVKGAGTVFVDPASARVLGVRRPGAGPTDWVLDLHRELLAGDAGNRVVIAGAIGMLGLCLSGLVLWAPRKGQTKWRWNLPQAAPALRVHREVHTVVGAYAAIALMVLAWTGLSFAFREPVLGLYAAVTASDMRSVKPPEVAPPPDARRVPVSTMVEAARRVFPTAEFRQMRLPADPTAAVQVNFFQPGEFNRRGNTVAYVDPYRGEVVGTIDPAHAPLAWRVYYTTNYPIHTGEWGGRLTQALWCLLGLMPALLFGTGASFWWLKTQAKQRAKRLAPTPVTAPRERDLSLK
jgi:uncharacterized iron-regulated membrane protein